MGYPKELAHIRKLFAKNQLFFNALGSDERQRLLLLMLEAQEYSVAELAMHIGLSRPTISHHLKILKSVGLIDEKRQGHKTIYCVAASPYLDSVGELIEEAKRLTKQKKEK